MAEAGKAVFLSYASEDAEAAQRICRALGDAGIEVWFDQSELRGGDAWDSAIRRQIKTCALFIPVISRATHSRGEGYFRLEWKLAVDRSHLMARNQPFLVPIVIDDTPNSDDRVPEQFSTVQWTRLPDGTATRAFIDRIKHLLTSPVSASDLAPAPVTRRPSSLIKALWALSALAVVGFGGAAIYRWMHNEAPFAGRSASNTFSSIPHDSIAVLPFTDVSQQKDQEYFSNGLSEELINQLSRIPSLRVPARRSSFFFKGKSDDISTIARMLLVAHILEGSVRRDGNNLRVTAELIRADSGYHLWSQTYDLVMKDIFKVQDEIASAVVTALKLRLGPMEPTASQRTSNTEAYDQFLQARQYYLRGTMQDYKLAIEALHRAVSLDPSYAAAYADLGTVTMAVAELTNDIDQLQEASKLMDKAIALGPKNPGGYAARGWMRTNFFWDWVGAESDFRKAVGLDLGNAEVYDNYGWLLQCVGRLPEAIKLGRKATELDPLSRPAWENLSRALTASHQYPEAHAAIAHSLEFSPDGVYSLSNLGTLQLLEGSSADALRTFRQVNFEGVRLQGVAMAQRSLGNVKESKLALDELISKFAHDGPYEIAEVYAWRGEKDKAFEWLERAFQQHDGGIANMKSDLLLQSLRGEAHYADLLKRMNLPL